MAVPSKTAVANIEMNSIEIFRKNLSVVSTKSPSLRLEKTPLKVTLSCE